jgi:hypothetical protein
MLFIVGFILWNSNNKLTVSQNNIQSGGLCAAEYNDINNMLNINLVKNNPSVASVEGVPEPNCNKPQPGEFIMPTYACSNSKKLSRKNIENITENQPPFLQDTMIRNYYDDLYYNDSRYPVRPISTEFAKNPSQYCCKNPQVYPCYVAESRYDLKFGKN